ncbi:MAG: ATP-dependent DNA helicase DinG [Proteobacteria bacterium]|nr:ATP-dependent DNA helicase DinG [Pseudomonadota bacterium]MDA0895217.1 ATP-dependent DNA helicase DinG [Pseudomonadota bacterium]MDA1243686.1 ATP-dependent DNA helicase DinG [Pseudomonadota bacterium]
MLAQTVKDKIQGAYRQMISAKKLTPRYGQRLMIAEIAKAFGSLPVHSGPPPIVVVEAGTGTGKTMAYTLAVLPIARELGLKVVIATATVALQEQVTQKDLPEILEASELDFTVSLAKGRGRYLCLSKLDMLLSGSDSLQAMMDLYGDDVSGTSTGDRLIYEKLLDALSKGEWDGDRDSWNELIAEESWQPLTVDNSQCMGPKCSNFRNCCFYQSRDSMTEADCIVSNHDLVLADLALGGGVILPEPENCLYVFDEAHHLPLKSNNHFAATTRIKSTMGWLEKSEKLFKGFNKDEFLDAKALQSLITLGVSLRNELDVVWVLLEQIAEAADTGESYEERVQYAFELGVIPESVRVAAQNLATLFTRYATGVRAVVEELKEALEEGGEPARRELAEQWYGLAGSTLQRAESCLSLWANYAGEDAQGKAPNARWLNYNPSDAFPDITLATSPVLAADALQERLWERCAGAVLTSATLSALGEFSMLKMRAGLPEHTAYLRILSPFNFGEVATLTVPKMGCLPSDVDKHTSYIAGAIPRLVDPQAGSLMLFSSRRQMLDVMGQLPREWLDRVLCQDDFQKSQLIKYHKQRVDSLEGSLIFGLASFAEGVDLPGEYCTHVLIAKIPFAVPNEPIEMTLAKWIEQQGLNPFMTLTVPDAAFKLVQATGRLLRNEKDYGKITLFDERLSTQRYGRTILASLPPYRLELLK